jgi:protein-tyrosine phosphatase
LIDLHSHVLPGLDDGAADLDEAVAICHAAAADGIEVLAATPHVRNDFPTSVAEMEAGVAAVSAAVGGLVRLLPGGELDLAELERPVDELRGYALGGNREYLLVETPYYGWPLDLANRLHRLLASGVTPVLAHPERNDAVQQQPELLDPLVRGGVLIQVTAASVDGRLGRHVRACVKQLLERSLVHLLASDAHSPSIRAIGLADAARSLGDDALARWLTVAIPGAIVDGAELPPRPAGRRPRWWSLGRARPGL